MSDEEINRIHKERWAAAIEKYGSPYKVPKEVAFEISEESRKAWGGLNENAEPKEKRADKHKVADDWVKANIGAQIKPAELAEAVDWSYSTALNYINDHVNTFIRVKHGVYEIRDEAAERAAAGK